MFQPMLEVRHLQVIEAVGRLASVTRAAETLHLTQPAITHAVREIERRLRVELVRRKGRGIEVTPLGEQLARRARAILGELVAAEEELGRVRAPGGVLRVATECYTCYHWLPSALGELRRRRPGLELRLAPESTRRPFEAVLGREVDLAIVQGTRQHTELEHVPLFTDELVAVLPPEHPLAGRPYLVAEDFRGENVLIHFDPEVSTLLTEVLAPAGVSPAHLAELHLTEAVIETVKAGLGVSVLARWAVAPHVQSGTLRAVPVTEQGLTRRWHACHLRGAGERPGIAELVEILRERGLG